jgi:hypothetical protein
MVAFDFDPRFETAIREGWKTQTIRKARERNARPGDLLQLYIGQRTPDCRRICPDVRCTDVLTIEITFGDDFGIDRIVTDGVPVKSLDDFAVRDGFTDSDDMAAFFKEKYGPLEVFHGYVIEWAAPRPAESEMAVAA